jgi:hypothetical protein
MMYGIEKLFGPYVRMIFLGSFSKAQAPPLNLVEVSPFFLVLHLVTKKWEAAKELDDQEHICQKSDHGVDIRCDSRYNGKMDIPQKGT